MTQMMIKSPQSAEEFALVMEVFDHVMEGNDFTWPRVDFYPSAPGNGGYDFMWITGQLPSYEWEVFHNFTEVQHTAVDQWYVRCDVVSYVSGYEDGLRWDNGGALGAWHDMWDEYELLLDKFLYNGILEHYETTISIAPSNGAGAPDLGAVQTFAASFKSYRSHSEYIVGDEFSDTNGLDLESHTPNVNRTGTANPWVDLYYAEADYTKATFNIYSNNARSNGTAASACYVMDVGESDVWWGTDIDYRLQGVEVGIIGRVQDTANFWLLACKNPDSSDPVLGLYKVAATVHTLVASYTATGLGPFDGFGKWTTFSLEFEGDNIIGRMNVTEQPIATYEAMKLTHTDSAYNTETQVGLWSADSSTSQFRRAACYPLPLGVDAIAPWSGGAFTSSIVDSGEYIYVNIYFYPGPNGPPVPPYDSTCGYWIDKDTIGQKQVIDYRLCFIATNTFIAKYEDVSGDTDRVSIAYGTEGAEAGVWKELYNLNIAIENDNDVPESLSATIDITVALRDGSGNPVSGSGVTRRVTIVADNT